MDALILNGTEDTPNVVLDTTTPFFSLSGRSLPEDVASFYDPVFAWLDEFEKSPTEKMDFEIMLEYFNTASSKIILDILTKLEDIHQSGNCAVRIKWVYDESDSDMMEAGEEYRELVELDFDMIGK